MTPEEKREIIKDAIKFLKRSYIPVEQREHAIMSDRNVLDIPDYIRDIVFAAIAKTVYMSRDRDHTLIDAMNIIEIKAIALSAPDEMIVNVARKNLEVALTAID